MSTSSVPRALLEVRYYQAAQEYLRNLTDENHTEATAQAYQRKITLESLDLVSARRSEVQVFNELLVQYPQEGTRRPGQVVPDNMVVLCDRPIRAEGSYDVPLQPVPPFWVLEYVSKKNRRKDYEQSMEKYEHHLKVPYYLLFVSDEQELTLYRHTGEKYVSVKPNDQGRYAIAELELELGLVDGWVRYWFRGELLPLPADLQRALDQERQARLTAERQAEEARRARLAAEQQAENARQAQLMAELSAERTEQELARLRDQIARVLQPPPSS
jgi:Uma2 family endonuclease